MTLPLTALILAGGRSSRMGTDKALLHVGGQSLLARAETLAARCGATACHILGRPDRETGIADRTRFAGPAMAVRDWLADHPGAGRILVLPVDMPRLEPNHLAPLLAAVPGACYARFFLPFSALAPTSALPAVDRVRELLELLQVQQLPVPDGADSWLANINSPADLAMLENGFR